MMSKFSVLLFCTACQTQGVIELNPSAVGDSADLVDTGQSEPVFVTDFSWCIDLEDGVLDGVGYSGNLAYLGNGAAIANIAEGSEFSALRGEELIEFRGERAVLMRSGTGGELADFSVIATPYFLVEQPMFSWWQISEVREEGIWLAGDLMDEAGYVLASFEIPVETGGYVPGRFAHQAPIEGLEEIEVGQGRVGQSVGQWVDLTEFVGQVIQFRFYQYTRIPQNAFFTLLDDFCLGATDELAGVGALPLGEPVDWGF